MKKILSLILSVVMLFSAVSSFAYTDYRSIPEGSDAEYLPYAENMTTTRYTPWFKLYHMQTAADAKNGVRGGEGGQVITCFGISPVNPDYVMFGVDTSGAWRSTDGGENWYQLREGSNTWAVTDIQWHPKYERAVYMAQTSTTGTDSSSVNKAVRTGQDGIWRSNDAGLTWKQVISSNTISATSTDTLICFDDNNNVYALTSEGVFKSTDDGDTFNCLAKLVYTDNAEAPFFTADYTNSSYTALADKYVGNLYVSPDGNTIVTATFGGFNISRDGGANWSKIEALGTGTGYSLAVNPLNPNHWISVSAGSLVYKSFDAGKTWETMSFYKYNNGKYYPTSVKFSYPKNGKTNIHMIFNNMTIPYAYSTDMGTTWKKPTLTENDRYTTHYRGYACEGFAMCASDPDLMFFSFGDIVYKSTNGGVSYEISCSGFSGNYVNQFYFDKDNRLWMAYTDKGLGVTDIPYDGETLPTAHMAGVTGTCKSVLIDPNDSNHIFANSGDWYTQTMKVSFDGGTTWSTIEGADTEVPWTFLVYDMNNKNIIYSPHYTSYDNGVNWLKNERRYNAISTVDDKVRFSIDSSNSKYFSYTTDAGLNWTEVNVSSGASTICPDLFDKNVFWVGHSAGWISKFTINEDGTLTRVTKRETSGIVGTESNEMKAMVNEIAQNPKDKNHLIAGVKCTNAGVSCHGIVETRDGGETWYPVPGARGPMTIYTVQFSPVSNEVFLGNCSGGTLVYEYDNYSNVNSISFNVNGDIAEGVESVSGKYGEKYTAVAPVIIDENYEFAGWEYYAEENVGNGEQEFVKKIYNAGDEVTFSYKDIELTAKFKRVNNVPNFTENNEEYTYVKPATNEMFVKGNNWLRNYISPEYLVYYLNENTSDEKSAAYYSIDIGGGNQVVSAKLKMMAEGISGSGTLNIYGYEQSFNEMFAEFTEEKTVKEFSVSEGTLVATQKLNDAFYGNIELEITDWVNSLIKKGKKEALFKVVYKTETTASGNDTGFGIVNQSWDKAVTSEITYASSDAVTGLYAGYINVTVTLPKGEGTVKPILGVYDRQNPLKLVKMLPYEDVELSENKETFYSAEIDSTYFDTSKYFIKFFVISDFGTITPITKNSILQ